MVLNGDSLNGDSAFSGIENQYQEGVIFFTSPHARVCVISFLAIFLNWFQFSN